MTEEYVDLNSRLTNKKATEKRLTVLLEERSGKLEEVLAFEKEIEVVSKGSFAEIRKTK